MVPFGTQSHLKFQDYHFLEVSFIVVSMYRYYGGGIYDMNNFECNQ